MKAAKKVRKDLENDIHTTISSLWSQWEGKISASDFNDAVFEVSQDLVKEFMADVQSDYEDRSLTTKQKQASWRSK